MNDKSSGDTDTVIVLGACAAVSIVGFLANVLFLA